MRDCQTNFNWTPERVDLLRVLHAKNVSYGAMALYHEFGGMTRNALIGKASRIGLPQRVKTPEWRAAKPKRERLPRPRRYNKRTPDTRKPLWNGKLPPLILRKHEDDVARVGILELTNETCRFPVGSPADATFGYCGKLEADLANDMPYCLEHHARCFTQIIRNNNPIRTSSRTGGFA